MNHTALIMEIDLYNLFVGPKLPPEELRSCKVGPFEVHLIDDYEQAVTKVYRPPYAKFSTQWKRLDPQPSGQDPAFPVGALEQTVQQVDEVRGTWVVTAKAITGEDTSQESVLAKVPIPDGGIWDLCELLTFITGRRVLTKDLLERFDPNRAGQMACVQAETLLAAALGWRHKQELAELGLAYALLSHNSAIDYRFLQPKAAQYNTALNILIDKWQLPKLPKVPRDVREALAKAVEDLVARWDKLSDEDRKGYTAVLRAKVMEGPYVMLDRLILFLRDLGIVLPDDGDPVLTRVKYLNTIRNRLTHSGEMPLLKGMTPEQSDRYTVNVVGGVLQELNQLAIGRVLGFTAGGPGSLSQDLSDLRRFFTEGVWHNHPIELKDFEEWIEDPLGLG